MRSKIAQKIIDQTPEDVKEEVRLIGDQMVLNSTSEWKPDSFKEEIKKFVFRFCEWRTSKGYCFDALSHPPSLNDRWNQFIGETNAMNDSFHLAFKSEEKTERVKCMCPCHKHKDIMHVVPCCDNGYVEMPTNLPAALPLNFKLPNERPDLKKEGQREPSFSEFLSKKLSEEPDLEKAAKEALDHLENFTTLCTTENEENIFSQGFHSGYHFNKLSEDKEEKSERQEELWEIVEWVADRFEKEFPGSTVGIMGRKAREILTRKGNTL